LVISLSLKYSAQPLRRLTALKVLSAALTRRQLIQVAAVVAAGRQFRPASAQDIARGVLNDAAAKARKFLVALIDPMLGILPEFRGSRVYWLYHDNYLAAKVLERSEPEKSERIMKVIRGFGVKGSGKIEILFNESRAPLPFHHHGLVEVKRLGPKIIKTEVLKDEIHTDWQEYTDLLFMATIAQAERDRAAAGKFFRAGLKTWDGEGFRDRVNQKTPRYATFKLALALIAGSRLDEQPAEKGKILERLLAMQRDDGGFVTDFESKGKRVGEANVETTALAIMALDSWR
jgi:hypothetical protein